MGDTEYSVDSWTIWVVWAKKRAVARKLSVNLVSGWNGMIGLDTLDQRTILTETLDFVVSVLMATDSSVRIVREGDTRWPSKRASFVEPNDSGTDR